jgi:asparagine N-glycosylation enzyme membrane subunit Stt3
MEEKKNQIWAFAITGLLIIISMLYYQANPYYM